MNVPRRDLGLRALCVPVRRPRHLALLGRGAVAGAAACAAAAAWWQAGPAGLAAVAGAGGAAVALRRRGRRLALPRARAVRAVAGSRRWQLRLGRAWRPATLRDSRRGACWLHLRLQLDGMAGQGVTNYRVAIWRSSVSAARWRRFCLLAGAAQRLDAPASGAP